MSTTSDDSESRAEQLLESMLTPHQRHSWRHLGHFDCVGSLGTHYRIKRGPGQNYNVHWHDNGRFGGALCAYPRSRDPTTRRPLPDADLVLGQFLTLVTDEAEFLRHANLSSTQGGGWPPTTPPEHRGYGWMAAEGDAIRAAVRAAGPPVVRRRRRLPALLWLWVWIWIAWLIFSVVNMIFHIV